MTVALIGSLVLLFGSVKVSLWLIERMVKRHAAYEAGRVEAGSRTDGAVVRWTEPSQPLRIFNR